MSSLPSMSSSVARASVSTPLNSSRGPQRTMEIGTSDDLQASDILELAREAMRRACGSLKCAAAALDIDAGQLNRQLAGKERFQIELLAKCPPICHEFAFLLALRLGFQPRSASVAERRKQRVRMLKMLLVQELDEELAESAS